MNTPHLWHCPNHHVLGYFQQEGRTKRLFLFRHALPVNPGELDFTVAGEVVGNAVWGCSICGARRRWYQCNEKASPERSGLAFHPA